MSVAADAAPIYLDWQFWAAVIACLALILSQLPPVRLWFRPRRFNVEVHTKFQVTHKVGNPNVGLFVSILNSSGRDLRVKSMKVAIYRDGTQLGIYGGQSYFENMKDSTQILLVPFTLRPGESWAHTTGFYNEFDRVAEKFYRECEAALSAQIRERVDARDDDDNSLVSADQGLVDPFIVMFDRNFIWEPGEYALELYIVAEPTNASFVGKYRFTIFESDTAELRKEVDGFKHGFGISIQRPNGVVLPIRPHGN